MYGSVKFTTNRSMRGSEEASVYLCSGETCKACKAAQGQHPHLRPVPHLSVYPTCQAAFPWHFLGGHLQMYCYKLPSQARPRRKNDQCK